LQNRLCQLYHEHTFPPYSILPRKSDIVEAAINMLFEKIERKNDLHKPAIIPFAFSGCELKKNRIFQNEK